MTINTQKSRPGSIVAEAFRLKDLAERGEKKATPEPAPTKAYASIPKGVGVKKPDAKKAAKKTQPRKGKK